jgi:hypothetical protein
VRVINVSTTEVHELQETRAIHPTIAPFEIGLTRGLVNQEHALGITLVRRSAHLPVAFEQRSFDAIASANRKKAPLIGELVSRRVEHEHMPACRRGDFPGCWSGIVEHAGHDIIPSGQVSRLTYPAGQRRGFFVSRRCHRLVLRGISPRRRSRIVQRLIDGTIAH